MMGYGGKMLRVNLSTGEVNSMPTDMQVARDFIGGRGFGIKHLYDELSPGIDPLGEDNKLILLTGVLAGTSALATSRWLALTKSPLTGCFARSSAGGDFGAWLKFAGYDYIIIEGKAEEPVYLYLSTESCQIKSAGELWGKNTEETQDWLMQRHGKNIRAACIGPAGENLVKYAAIVTGTRTASRCGVGTVMGSKNLKAVAIQAKRNLTLHDPEGFRQLVKEQVNSLRVNREYLLHKKFGTTEGAISRNMLGVYPTKNFRFEKWTAISSCLQAYMERRVDEFVAMAVRPGVAKSTWYPSEPMPGLRVRGRSMRVYGLFLVL